MIIRALWIIPEFRLVCMDSEFPTSFLLLCHLSQGDPNASVEGLVDSGFQQFLWLKIHEWCLFWIKLIMIYKMKGENTQNTYPLTFLHFFNLSYIEADVYTLNKYNQLQLWHIDFSLREWCIHVISFARQYLLVCICICPCLGEESEFANVIRTNNRLEKLCIRKFTIWSPGC